MNKQFFDKRDYYALQDTWRELVHQYINTFDPAERVLVMDDFRDSLVDIGKEKKQLRTTYEEWEKTFFYPYCEEKIVHWIKQNPYESGLQDNVDQEYKLIIQEYNYLRFRKIRQVIQDSGIGFGTGRDRKSIDRKGYDGK